MKNKHVDDIDKKNHIDDIDPLTTIHGSKHKIACETVFGSIW